MFRFLVFLVLLACAFGNSILPKYSSPHGRIVGGKDTTIEKHPYQVSVRLEDGRHFCGGSIVESKKVISAAHCFNDKPNEKFAIQYGLTEIGTSKNVISVANVTCHPDFSYNTAVADVCVLRLDSDIPFSDSARPIPLAKEEPSVGAKAVVTGWGYLKEVPDWMPGPEPDVLQEVEIKIIDREACKLTVTGFKVDNSMLCAGVGEGGKDACKGDSGGPLAVDNILVGVVSWGNGCAREDSPGVYANVAGLRDWIDSH